MSCDAAVVLCLDWLLEREERLREHGRLQAGVGGVLRSAEQDVRCHHHTGKTGLTLQFIFKAKSFSFTACNLGRMVISK